VNAKKCNGLLPRVITTANASKERCKQVLMKKWREQKLIVNLLLLFIDTSELEHQEIFIDITSTLLRAEVN